MMLNAATSTMKVRMMNMAIFSSFRALKRFLYMSFQVLVQKGCPRLSLSVLPAWERRRCRSRAHFNSGNAVRHFEKLLGLRQIHVHEVRIELVHSGLEHSDHSEILHPRHSTDRSPFSLGRNQLNDVSHPEGIGDRKFFADDDSGQSVRNRGEIFNGPVLKIASAGR